MFPDSKDDRITHHLQILRALTVAGLLRWQQTADGLFNTTMGPFDVFLDTRDPYSKENPYLNTHAPGGLGYNYSFYLPEVVPLLKLVKAQIKLSSDTHIQQLWQKLAELHGRSEDVELVEKIGISVFLKVLDSDKS